MRTELIEKLHCPYCGSRFEIEKVLEGGGEELNTGVVACECNKFPVLEGILRLINDELSEPIIEHLGRGEQQTALVLALRTPYSQVTNTLIKLVLEVARGLNFRPGERTGAFFAFAVFDARFFFAMLLC